MIKPTAPCMGCSDKHIGCHGICEECGLEYSIRMNEKDVRLK